MFPVGNVFRGQRSAIEKFARPTRSGWRNACCVVVALVVMVSSWSDHRGFDPGSLCLCGLGLLASRQTKPQIQRDRTGSVDTEQLLSYSGERVCVCCARVCEREREREKERE